eukprot:COSAG02_NODE_5087_length_4644_cov_7.739714_2_plen_109_part_00
MTAKGVPIATHKRSPPFPFLKGGAQWWTGYSTIMYQVDQMEPGAKLCSTEELLHIVYQHKALHEAQLHARRRALIKHALLLNQCGLPCLGSFGVRPSSLRFNLTSLRT